MPNAANFESNKCTDREQNYFLKPFSGDGAETEHCISFRDCFYGLQQSCMFQI